MRDVITTTNNGEKHMEFLKNISINLRATGASAVLITWLLCMTAIGLFGSGTLANFIAGALASIGVILIGALGQKIVR
jgi:hypothetical protein